MGGDVMPRYRSYPSPLRPDHDADRILTTKPENDWTECEECGHTVHVDEAKVEYIRGFGNHFYHPECLEAAEAAEGADDGD
jgi:hypothetical protein